MNENEKQNVEDVATPPNIDRALELLREVREFQRQVPLSDVDDATDDTVNQNLAATAIVSDPAEQAQSDDQEEADDVGQNSADQLGFPASLARFQIEQQIGSGGFARVFLAHDPKLNRRVALKVPNLSSMANLEARERFDREARAAGILSHPAIVPVFESGNVGPLSFIAYEYCDGETLADWLERQRGELSFKQAANIVEQLAHAVEHAHQRGVLHRDLKPANVLVQNSDDEDAIQLRITDFGLAKNYQNNDSFETTEGAIVGTPAYMSPEQASGRTDIGKATDIFSLGVIFYELLTGKLPFETQNQIKTLHAVVNNTPVAPSKLGKKLPANLEAVCLKCLEKEPSRRYESAFALANDLNRWSQGFNVTARRPTAIERASAWCKRNPVITFALVGMAIGFAFAIYQWNQATKQTAIAVGAAEQAQRNIELSRETIKSMVTDICTSSSIDQKFGRKLLVKAIDLQKQLLDESSNDPEILIDTAQLYLQYSVELTNARELNLALEAADDGLAVLATLVPEAENLNLPDKEVSSRLWLHKAQVYSILKRFDESREALQVASGQSNELPPMQQAHTAEQKAIALALNGEWEDAWIESQNAIIMYRGIEPKNDFNKMMVEGSLASTHFWRGKIEFELKRYREAEQTLHEGRRLIQPVMAMAPNHESLEMESARLQRELGRTQFALAKYAESRTNMRESIAAYDSLVENYPQTPRYALFAFNLRLDLIGLELETTNLAAARELVLQLDDDYSRISFEKFSDGTKLHAITEIVEANLALMEAFNEIGNQEFVDEHHANASRWIAVLKREFPDAANIATLEGQISVWNSDD